MCCFLVCYGSNVPVQIKRRPGPSQKGVALRKKASWPFETTFAATQVFEQERDAVAGGGDRVPGAAAFRCCGAPVLYYRVETLQPRVQVQPGDVALRMPARARVFERELPRARLSASEFAGTCI